MTNITVTLVTLVTKLSQKLSQNTCQSALHTCHSRHKAGGAFSSVHMTSLEIAEVTGRRHCDVMRAIRNMEPAWEKVNGRKFELVEYRDRKGELLPCYSLTKTECLYVATKFNDEAGRTTPYAQGRTSVRNLTS